MSQPTFSAPATSSSTRFVSPATCARPASLTAALVITVTLTLVAGVVPGALTHFTDPITLLAVGH